LNIQFAISNAGILLVVLVSLSIALSYLLYFIKKNDDEFIKSQRIVLSSLRFLSAFILSFLLLSPLIETIKNRIEKPILLVGIDNSESVVNDTLNRNYITNLVTDFESKLSEKFQIEILTFGEKLSKGISPDFSSQKSNYSNFLSEIDKRYYNLNVGALVLVGDGIYNEGKNPIQHQLGLKSPIYSVGVGDTLSKIDQAIADVTNNPNVFLNNTFPVEVEVTFTEFTQPSTQLSIYINGKLSKSEKIEVVQANYYFNKTYNIIADQIGLKNVEIVLSPLSIEQNKKNNRYRFTIEVHDNQKEVLILSQGPHPDIGALTQTLKSQANFKITSENISLYNGNITDYDLIVLNQLPSLRSQHLDIFGTLKEANVPLLLIVGPSTSISALNNLNIGVLLNPTLLNQESAPYFNETFSLFSLPPSIKEVEKIYPPLLSHFTEYEIRSEFDVLAYQQINGIEMNYPLLIAGEIENRKIGAIMGEGIWRWRIHEFQNYGNQNAFNQLIVSLFNYLSLKEERDQFRIKYNRICSETSPVKIKAQVFNEIYEPVNNAEVNLILTDSTGNELSYLFDANNSEYNLNLGYLSPGNYTFEATTAYGDESFTKGGTFNVEEVNIEQQNLQANFKVLNQLSNNTGGKLYLKEKSSTLIDHLNNEKNIQEKSHKENSIQALIDWKWFLIILMLMLSLEWFLRKFWGSY
jgi:hypothetical protein